MDLGIRGRHALVLASSRGLGLGVATALAAEGVNVMLASRDEARLKEAAAGLAAQHGVRAEASVCDLGSPDSVEALADAALAAFGHIDILVNNTGGPPAGVVTAVDISTWYRQFDQMIMSVFRITGRLLPGMRSRNWGRILTIASSSVIQPIPQLGISNTLRPALVAWSKSLSNEVAADGVTVNVILPGRIRTARVEELDRLAAQRLGKSVEDIVKQAESQIPMVRYGRVDEFASAAAFLVSERASYMTGSVVRVDGGAIRSL
jgi:3-oxoacyl-[acyl-carrier protein] reductase